MIVRQDGRSVKCGHAIGRYRARAQPVRLGRRLVGIAAVGLRAAVVAGSRGVEDLARQLGLDRVRRGQTPSLAATHRRSPGGSSARPVGDLRAGPLRVGLAALPVRACSPADFSGSDFSASAGAEGFGTAATGAGDGRVPPGGPVETQESAQGSGALRPRTAFRTPTPIPASSPRRRTLRSKRTMAVESRPGPLGIVRRSPDAPMRAGAVSRRPASGRVERVVRGSRGGRRCRR